MYLNWLLSFSSYVTCILCRIWLTTYMALWRHLAVSIIDVLSPCLSARATDLPRQTRNCIRRPTPYCCWTQTIFWAPTPTYPHICLWSSQLSIIMSDIFYWMTWARFLPKGLARQPGSLITPKACTHSMYSLHLASWRSGRDCPLNKEGNNNNNNNNNNVYLIKHHNQVCRSRGGGDLHKRGRCKR